MSVVKEECVCWMAVDAAVEAIKQPVKANCPLSSNENKYLTTYVACSIHAMNTVMLQRSKKIQLPKS